MQVVDARSLSKIAPRGYHGTRLNHSHSIVLSDDNALIYQRNFFLHTMKNRPPDPSKIWALDFKSGFRRSAIFSVPATIDINRSIFRDDHDKVGIGLGAKNTVSLSSNAIALSEEEVLHERRDG